MAKIKKLALAKAIQKTKEVDLVEAEKIADEIYKEQPNLLASVLVMSQMGAKMEQVDIVLRLLMVAHLALKYSGVRIKTITEDQQRQGLARFSEQVKFTEGLVPELQKDSIDQFIKGCSEKLLMAYIIQTLTEEGIASVQYEHDKYLIMASINIAQCIDKAKQVR